VFWAVVLALVPTECTRLKIADRLSKATGRTVKLGKIRVGFLAGVHLGDLQIGAPTSGDDPWLSIDEASLDVCLLQLLLGRINPSQIDVNGARLRVLRRTDGSLELADLVQGLPLERSSSGSSDDGQSSAASDFTIRVRNASIQVVDEPTRTRLEVTDVQARGTCKGRLASITELKGSLNDGILQLAAQLDRSGASPTFEGQIRATGVELGEGTSALCYLAPVLTGAPENLEGKLSMDFYVRGRGGSRAELQDSVLGHGTLSLDPVSLDRSEFLAAVRSLVDLPDAGRIGLVRTDLTIKAGKLISDNLTIELSQLPLVLAGSTDFNGRIDYRLRLDRVKERLPEKARDLLAELTSDVQDSAELTLRGTVDAPVVSLNGAVLRGGERDPRNRGDDREALREIGRRLRDRIRR
jgi:AsmA protein